jgi:hypothetical protein
MTNFGDDPQEYSSMEEAIDDIQEQLDQDDEGTFIFKILESNLTSRDSDGSLIQEIESGSGNKGIRLLKKDKNRIVYEFFEIDIGMKRCSIGLDNFTDYSDFFVCLTWSPERISLHIAPTADDYEGDLASTSSSEIISQVRRDEKDNLVFIGDSGIEVGYYHIRQSDQDILRPKAKEIFEFAEKKSRTLLEVARDNDEFLIESTVAQQIIVMLVTGLETYLEERFIELCSEKNISDEEIASAMASFNYGEVSKDDFLDQAEDRGISIEELARDHFLNFQDIDEADKVYSQTLGYDLQAHLNNTGNRGVIERNIDARHSIIHEATDMTIINIERVPPQDPIFANSDHGLKVIETFSDTVAELQESTGSI